MKEIIAEVLKKALAEKKVNLDIKEITNLIEIPPSTELGDFAFPCFFLASKLKEDPKEIAINLRGEIKKIPKGLEDIQTNGPYINFFLDKRKIITELIQEICDQKENFGKSDIGKGKTVLLDFSSPNIAKPFGIGHLRSTIIGNSIAKLSEFMGYKTIKMNYLGDWGTQFGKVIFGYRKFGNPKKLEGKDAIKHLLDIYVKANKKDYEEQARIEFQGLELGDKENLELWKKFKEISLAEFQKIYSILGVNFDVYSGESFYNGSMDAVIDALDKKNLLKESEGAMIVDLEKEDLGVALIQKADKTSIYMTRDIAAALDRYHKYKFDRMIYEVGQEQSLHFRQLFYILKQMGHKWADNCVHVSHGLYLGKDGKKLSTREGKTISMDSIIEETVKLVQKEIKKREPKISKAELEKRALRIAVSAIFYGDLKNNRTNNIIFDLNRFVSFDGDTGPYLLYSYARASSIIQKSKKKSGDKVSVSSIDEKEFELAKKLLQFREIALNAYNSLNPSLIANYSYQLAQLFSEFYHACPVIGSENESFRLCLVDAFRTVLKNSLNLLGIETIDKM